MTVCSQRRCNDESQAFLRDMFPCPRLGGLSVALTEENENDDHDDNDHDDGGIIVIP